MKNLDKSDFQLIEKAKQAIKNNYDEKSFLHTVGAALKCKNGNIYVGVNVYSIHGACAEQVALGSAITAGERNFEAIVAINGENGEVMSPCGNCRQILSDYMPECYVIIKTNDNILIKIKAKELLPYPYRVS